jgi:sugar phosphate isomerase/epimerase
VIAKLEDVSPKNFYFHGSGIEFKNFQEKRHLTAKTCAPPLPHLLQVLKEGGYEYTFIVESPNAIEDVLWLREVLEDPSGWIEFAERKMRESGLQATLD